MTGATRTDPPSVEQVLVSPSCVAVTIDRRCHDPPLDTLIEGEALRRTWGLYRRCVADNGSEEVEV